MTNPILLTAIIFALAYLIYNLAILARTRVPFVATPRKLLKKIAAALPIDANTVLYDLGCGRGALLFATEKYGPKKLIGYELSPLHVWYAKLKTLLTGSKIKINRVNFFSADISNATLIYLFLVPSIVQKAWAKIQREAPPGTLVATLADAIRGARCIKQITRHPGRANSRTTLRDARGMCRGGGVRRGVVIHADLVIVRR